ncbi:hypothetical protein [Nostoc sp. FACHB-190]|uniref:hypothetical protein n=1 Tax=Nostoc sp. FACHB-190 TaxID=2692838 RepID=UPI0016854AB7|nr:hypothetical protein [Nostoc sp. FACHB-190]MBD2302800.1 hypothetical protein [Nostoc sp. FACHB-190]
MSSKLITPESPLLVPPLLAAEIGLEEAVILQQIHYFCQISKHIKADGRRWFWKTLQDWGQTLPFLKISTIRRAIANLRNFELIDVCRHSQKTWYQANWFTVNLEKVEALWNQICQKQQIELSALNTSICSPPTDHIKEFPSKEFSSQQHAAAAEEEKSELEESQISDNEPELVCLTPQPEQPQTLRFVDEQEMDYSTNEEYSHKDELSGADDKANLNVFKQEIAEVCNELRRLRINPQPCLGVIKKHWANVQGAIARVKDAIAEGWCDNPTGLFINSCKSGAKGKNTVTADVSAWFEWARRQRIVLAMSGNVVYTVDGEAVELREMMRKFPGGG